MKQQRRQKRQGRGAGEAIDGEADAVGPDRSDRDGETTTDAPESADMLTADEDAETDPWIQSAEAVDQRRQLSEAKDELERAKAAVSSKVDEFEAAHRRHAERLFDRASTTVGLLIDFRTTIGTEAFEQLREDPMDFISDVILSLASGGFGKLVGKLGKKLGGALFGKWFGEELGGTVGEKAGQKAGEWTSKGTGSWLRETLGSLEKRSDDFLDEQIRLLETSDALAKGYSRETFAVVEEVLFSERSPLASLRETENRGFELRGGIRATIDRLESQLTVIEGAGPIKQRLVEQTLQYAHGLLDEYEKWVQTSEVAAREAAEAVPRVVERIRRHYSWVVDLYASAGGSVPMGPHRAELARIRLEDRLIGKTGVIGSDNRWRNSRGLALHVDGDTFSFAQSSYAHPGQQAAVLGVELHRTYRGEEGRRQTERIESYSDRMFVVDVALGTYPTRVPHVVGLPVDQAKERVERRGLELTVRYQPSEIRPGVALGISPPPDGELESGDEVVLFVSE